MKCHDEAFSLLFPVTTSFWTDETAWPTQNMAHSTASAWLTKTGKTSFFLHREDDANPGLLQKISSWFEPSSTSSNAFFHSPQDDTNESSKMRQHHWNGQHSTTRGSRTSAHSGHGRNAKTFFIAPSENWEAWFYNMMPRDFHSSFKFPQSRLRQWPEGPVGARATFDESWAHEQERLNPRGMHYWLDELNMLKKRRMFGADPEMAPPPCNARHIIYPNILCRP
ncbi:unnamed protein product, partial [Amoebophrya sp. A25]|eukprot:GSA25T00004351001.1